MPLFDLTHGPATSEGNISLPDQGNIRVELHFDKSLSEIITCLLYLDYDNCAYRSTAHCFRRLLMLETAQILCTLKHVLSFLDVYPSDILPPLITCSATVIVNTDPHTAKGTHWLAIRLKPRSYPGYFFDSYGLPPFIPSILTFLRRVVSVYDYNSTQLQV